MILTCPACSTRYTVDEAKFPPAGRTVRCAKCGHSWHQPGPEPEPEPQPDPVLAAAPSPQPGPAVDEPAAFTASSSGASSGSATRAYAPAAQVTDKPKGQALQTAAVAAGWIGLVAVVLLIGWSAVRYRQDIAAIWPQSATVYSSVGLKVNAGGIDFRDVTYKQGSEDGQPALVVTGKIVNLASRELPIPQSVRVTLYDADKRELYHWPFKPGAATLKPGATLDFRTRISNPPAAARSLEVSFSKDGS